MHLDFNRKLFPLYRNDNWIDDNAITSLKELLNVQNSSIC